MNQDNKEIISESMSFVQNQERKINKYYKPIPKELQKKRGRKPLYDTPEMKEAVRKQQDIEAHRRQRERNKLLKIIFIKLKEENKLPDDC